MADPTQKKDTVLVAFKMADPEGTAPLRVVAGHAQRVGEAWAALSVELFGFADALDKMVEGASDA